MKKLLMLPFTLMATVFGNVSWSSPPWLITLNKVRKTNVLAFWGSCSGLMLILAAYLYYDSLPKPITIVADIQPLQITPNNQNAKPDELYIAFNYDYGALGKGQKQPQGHPSVARIDLVGKEIVKGIKVTPTLKGQWFWQNERQIKFVPASDWPAGVDYKVTFDRAIFVSEAQFTQQTYSFTTPPLVINFAEIAFYQDPTDITLRRVISTLHFSHPVDKTSLEKSLSMNMRPSGGDINQAPEDYKFHVTYDKNYREAYIQSEPIALPKQPNYMKLQVAAGVKTLLGGERSDKAIQTKQLIPDIFSFLQVKRATAQIVRNEENDPKQILMLEFTDDIEEKELLSKLSMYLLPVKDSHNNPRYWRGPRQVTSAVLANSESIKLSLLPIQSGAAKNYSFSFDIPEGRDLYLKIDKGLTSVNKFVYASFFDTLLKAPSYPKEVNIAGEGSVMTYSGEHKLSILSRGVSTLKYSVGKLLDNQIYHLVSQTRGDMTNPRFKYWQFDSSNLAEFDSKMVDINANHPKDANYSSLDLTRYLPDKGDRFGLFFVDVKGWDKVNNREIYNTNDSRLILVTDLGIIVKNSVDNSHDVFIQSIQTGDPVARATVELLGKNGIPLYTRTTTENGHVQFPSTTDFRGAREPTVYVVKAQGDISFIPFARSSRQINLSRFDIGGVSSRYQLGNGLNAYLFSDRGIYRPGEEVNIGLIVKKANLANVGAIPLEVVVRGPRHNEVKVHKQLLLQQGFFDFNYATQATSDTGQYEVSLHLVRDNNLRGRQIGSAYFKVEEFQPDTLKIDSKLVNVIDKGWYNQAKLIANVSLKNLFGLPAQQRKMTGRVVINTQPFSFKEYQNYRFSSLLDNTVKPLRTDEMLLSQKSDANGLTQFEIDLQRYQQGTYHLRFITEGFDQGGGRSVVAANTALISPADYLVGYKADGKLDYINADSKRAIEFIAIDNQLNQIKKNDLRLKQIEIEQLSTLIKQRNGTYKYQTIKREKELRSEPISIAQSGYQYDIDTKVPGNFALQIIDELGKTISRVEYSVVGFANMAGKLNKNAELQLKLDKADYRAGQVIEMNITAPYSGAGLITIESDKVHRFKWFKTTTQSSIQTIVIPTNLEGNAYVNVTFVRDVGSKEIFASPLSYAVKPFSIDKRKRRIDIELGVNAIERPGKPMVINYSTSKKSKIVLFAIDEGILQVAKYKTPKPLEHFLTKRALDVETLQILDLILPEFDLVKQLSASGGGVMANRLGKNLNPFSRKVDKPAVYWSGIRDAGPQNQQVTFDIPNTFAGQLRVMAVAVGEKEMGMASEQTIVRGPFVISPNVLTQAAPSDEFTVTVGIANIIDGSGENAEVEVVVESSEHLQILGDAANKAIKLNISEGNEGQFTFQVKVNELLGAAELRFTASHKNESASRTASLSVRPPIPYYSSFESGFSQSGAVELVSDRTLYSNLAEQSVAASASPLVLVDGLTAYLDAFPHGCTEQVVSKVFPLVGLAAHPAFSPHLSKVQHHFAQLIDKLRQRQLSDGGFAFWPGSRKSAQYPSIYVMHFLIEARDSGFAVPQDMIQRGKVFLTDFVGRTTDTLSAARDRANAIYLLTRLGMVTTNYLVDLQDTLDKDFAGQYSSDLLVSYMASTYKLLQKEQQANRLISGYEFGIDDEQAFDDFHSRLALDAQHLYLLSKHFESRAKLVDGDDVRALTNRIFKGEYNTISAAYSILALGAYSKLVLAQPLDEAILFASLISKGQKTPLAAKATPFLTAHYPVQTRKVTIEGEQPLFFLNVQSGFNKAFGELPVKQGIEVYRDFVDDNNNPINSFSQGQEVTVRLKVRALGHQKLTNIALIDLLPGGFEVLRDSVSRTAYDWRADYIDVREDRVVYYGDFDSTLKELSYKVKLTSAGHFVIPPTFAQSMYDRSIRGVSKAGMFRVHVSK